MVMLRPKGKPAQIAKEVLKNKGIKVPTDKNTKLNKTSMPYSQK